MKEAKKTYKKQTSLMPAASSSSSYLPPPTPFPSVVSHFLQAAFMDSEQWPSRVPKFGDWDNNEENLTFTAAFEGAARLNGTKGNRINPNDPEQNPAAFAAAAAAAVASAAGGNFKNNGRKSNKVIDQRSKGSDSRPNIRDSGGQPEVERLKSGGSKPSRVSDQPEIVRLQRAKSGGNEGSRGQIRDANDQPEITRLQSAKLGGHLKTAFVDGLRRSRRANSVKSNSETEDSPPQRRTSSMRAKADIENVERVQGLPKFGEWNEMNPSAEGFTIIFNQARSEKKSGGVVRIPTLNPAAISPRQIYCGRKPPYNLAAQNKQPSIWTCCFSASDVQ